MRLFARAALAATLLAACNAPAPARSPSPATAPPQAESSTAAPIRSTPFATAQAPSLAETHAVLPTQSRRANGTRTALIVAAVAAATNTDY